MNCHRNIRRHHHIITYRSAVCELPKKKEQGEFCRLRPKGPKTEARRDVVGVGFLGRTAARPLPTSKGSGERCKLPQRGPGRNRGRTTIFLCFGSPDSLFCYVIKGKQLQKYLNLTARGVMPSSLGSQVPKITQAGGY